MKWLRFFPILLFAFVQLIPIRADAEAWRGSWIWRQGDPSPKNFYLYCRKTFDLAGEARSANLRITADSRYILFVNGAFVNQGPIRSDPRWQSYDEWDIARFLRKGRNAICVLVHHYGEGTFSYIEGRGGLWVDGAVELKDGTSIDILSDESWKLRPAAAWTRDIPRMCVSLGFSEIFDANKDPSTWTTVGFDDSYWDSATVIGPPPQEPWTQLVARDIPAATTTQLVFAKRVVSVSNVIPAEQQFHFDFTSVISPKEWGVVYAYTQVYSENERKMELVCGSSDGIHVWLGGQSVIERNRKGKASPNQNRAEVTLPSGWTPLLVKVTQTEEDWELYLRLEGEGVKSLRFSSTQDQGQKHPTWHILGPFENENNIGFGVVYPPEIAVDLSATYTGKGNKQITWQRYEVPEETRHPALDMSHARIIPRRKGDVGDLQKILKPEGKARIRSDAETGISIILDFDREVSGYPEITISQAKPGTRIDIGYSETLTEDGKVDPYTDHALYADRYICRAGPQTFRTFDKRAFRYLRLDVYHTQGFLQLDSVKVNVLAYPVTPRGKFSSPDETLTRIWKTGADTLRLNMDDVFTDSPSWERALRCGDARIEMLCNYYAFGDIALGRRCIRLIGQSQTDDGRLYGIYPTQSENAFIPDYTLVWMMSLWDDYFWTGDDSLIKEWFPALRRALEWFSKQEDPHGLLGEIPGKLFIDQAGIDKSGECAALNAFYYKALRDAASMANALGDSSTQKNLEKRAKRVKKAFQKRFWDKKQKVFHDARRGEEVSETISWQTNALAILFGLAPKKNGSDILSFISNPENQIVEVTPYFSFYLLGALYEAGWDSRAYNYIRQRWGNLLDTGATTWWEKWNQGPSHCSGGSAAPTYFLPAYVVGLRPTSPGWKTAILEPCPNDLKQVSATVPTPLGDISAKVTQRSGGYLMGIALTCPAGCQTTVSFPLVDVVKPRVLFDGKKEWPDNVEPLGEKNSRLLYQVTGPASLRMGLQSVPR